MFPCSGISLHAVVHSVLILESGNAAQDISKLGICHPGGRRAAVAPEGKKKKFQDGKENNGWKNVCLLPVTSLARVFNYSVKLLIVGQNKPIALGPKKIDD